MTSNSVRFLFILGLLLITIKTSVAQENYLPGYYIDLDSDTLNGYINYRNWKKNPEQIDFKSDLDQEKHIKLGYMDIKGFKVANEYYFSKKVKIEVSSRKIGTMNSNPTLVLDEKHAFLQTLVEGEKSLYLYVSKEGYLNYYIGNLDSLELLEYKQFKKEKDGRSYITENKKYIGQLNIYLQKCPKIFKLLADTEYKTNSLVKLFNSYYNCTEKEQNYVKTSEILKLAYGLSFGYSSTSLSTSNSETYRNLSQADFQVSKDLFYGINLDIIIPRSMNRLAFQNELMYTSYSAKGVYSYYVNEDNYSTRESTFNHSYIKFNSAIRYGLPIKKVSILLFIGVSGARLIDYNNKTVETTMFYSENENVSESTAFEKYKKSEFYTFYGAGIGYSKIRLTYSREKGNGFSDVDDIGIITRKSTFALTYMF